MWILKGSLFGSGDRLLEPQVRKVLFFASDLHVIIDCVRASGLGHEVSWSVSAVLRGLELSAVTRVVGLGAFD